MRQRTITVPKDKTAEKALDFDEAKKEQLIEISIEEEEFLFMYQNGIIELINTDGDANIDDFEDDFVRGKENLSKVIKALKLKENVKNNTQHQLIIQKVLSLFQEAFDRGTGVYFYF